MKSTPGPWMNREGYYGQARTADVIKTVFEHKTFINSMMQKTIAHMDAVMWAEKDSEEVQEMKANAHLLASAPKLLEACKLVLESLQQAYETAFDAGDIPATNFLKPNIGLLDKTISEAEK